jgi:hypothetical protein
MTKLKNKYLTRDVLFKINAAQAKEIARLQKHNNEIVDIRNQDQLLFEERILEDKLSICALEVQKVDNENKIKVLEDRENNYVVTVGKQTAQIKNLINENRYLRSVTNEKQETIYNIIADTQKQTKQYDRLEVVSLVFAIVSLVTMLVLL